MTEAHDIGHSLLQIGPIDRPFRLLILRNSTRRIVNGIAAKDEKLLDPASTDLPGQLENAVRFRVSSKLPHDQRRADILERGIDGVGQELHHDRLMRPGQDQARAGFRQKIVGNFRSATVRRISPRPPAP